MPVVEGGIDKGPITGGGIIVVCATKFCCGSCCIGIAYWNDTFRGAAIGGCIPVGGNVVPSCVVVYWLGVIPTAEPTAEPIREDSLLPRPHINANAFTEGVGR